MRWRYFACNARRLCRANCYGYLRTRAGLQHFNLFTDKKFTAVLKPARTRLCWFVSMIWLFMPLFLPELSAQRRAALATRLFAPGIAACR